MIKGIDASSVQGALPFKQLVDIGIRFAILKAQQGNDGFDPWFERNMRGCLENGIEPFAYCFFYPIPVTTPDGVTDPRRAPEYQAKLFVDRVYRFPEMRGRPLFLDYEWPEVVARPPKIMKGWKEWGCSPSQMTEAMRANAAEVHTISGARPVIYTYDWWWAAIRDGAPTYGFPNGADVSWAADYELWMAWYVKSWPGPGSKPRIPKPWARALFWQWDGNGGELLPNGVDSDFCVFDGDEADLRVFVHGGSDSTPTIEVAVPSRRPPCIEDLGDFRKVPPLVPLGRPALDGDLPTTPPDDEPPPAA